MLPITNTVDAFFIILILLAFLISYRNFRAKKKNKFKSIKTKRNKNKFSRPKISNIKNHYSNQTEALWDEIKNDLF